MALTVVPPPRTRRWTRVECERLIELGVFQPGPGSSVPVADLFP